MSTLTQQEKAILADALAFYGDFMEETGSHEAELDFETDVEPILASIEQKVLAS